MHRTSRSSGITIAFVIERFPWCHPVRRGASGGPSQLYGLDEPNVGIKDYWITRKVSNEEKPGDSHSHKKGERARATAPRSLPVRGAWGCGERWDGVARWGVARSATLAWGCLAMGSIHGWACGEEEGQ